MIFGFGSSEILIYTDGGAGASVRCVGMALASLKKAVSELKLPFEVRCTDSTELLTSEWDTSCQLLVMPGGRDLPYCRELDGKGNQNIRAFVEGGGSYLGICAGAYYGSAYVEFAKNDPSMSVVGPRELAFFPVTAVGPVLPGFSYDTNSGAHVAGISMTVPGEAILGEGISFTSLFYNGGCYFKEMKSDRASSTDKSAPANITLATYTGHSEPRPPYTAPCVSGYSAIVGGRVGLGKVLLTGLHFEASPDTLVTNYEDDGYVTPLLPLLSTFEPQRDKLFKTCVHYLLTANTIEQDDTHS